MLKRIGLLLCVLALGMFLIGCGGETKKPAPKGPEAGKGAPGPEVKAPEGGAQPPAPEKTEPPKTETKEAPKEPAPKS